MARPRKPPPEKKPEFAVYTFSLTPGLAESLQGLSNDVSDVLGRTVSGSAIVRALIRQAVQQGAEATDALVLEVEKELNAGVLWGGKKK